MKENDFSSYNLINNHQFAMEQLSKIYDLEERTSKFGQDVVDFVKMMKQDAVTKPLISQLVRSGTSVGANYMEANGASSKRDFRNKIAICKKEAQETKHWLNMVARAERSSEENARQLWDECQQLVLIFQKIMTSLDKKKYDV